MCSKINLRVFAALTFVFCKTGLCSGFFLFLFSLWEMLYRPKCFDLAGGQSLSPPSFAKTWPRELHSNDRKGERRKEVFDPVWPFAVVEQSSLSLSLSLSLSPA